MEKHNCVRVNADYEQVLFHGNPGPAAMNEALEFLAFYLQDLPVLSAGHYPDAYLSEIGRLTGRIPQILRSGNHRNWWGPLEDLPRERELNSKLTSAALAQREDWSRGRIVAAREVQGMRVEEATVLKDPFGMSGRGIFLFQKGEEIRLPRSSAGSLILEPYLERKYDFSHFIFPDGRMICYENLIDGKFQYRGTIIRPGLGLSSLSFYPSLQERDWAEFSLRLERIRDFYGDPSPYGYSVDSFVYASGTGLRIHALAEVNFRRTMGLCAFELARLLSPEKVCALTLKAPLFGHAIRLSPPGVRFEIYFSSE